jgi:hypothetical protein
MESSRLKKWAEALGTGHWVCREAGMDGFLTKPGDPAALDSMLSELFPNISRAAA